MEILKSPARSPTIPKLSYGSKFYGTVVSDSIQKIYTRLFKQEYKITILFIKIKLQFTIG